MSSQTPPSDGDTQTACREPEWLRRVAAESRAGLDDLPAIARPTWYRERVNNEPAWWEEIRREGGRGACEVSNGSVRPSSTSHHEAGSIDNDQIAVLTSGTDSAPSRASVIRSRLPVAQIITFWCPGSHDWTWAEEYRDLIDKQETREIAHAIDRAGFGFADSDTPVMLGNDGRVWDGHHRIVLAISRGESHLNVDVVTP